MGLAQVMRGDHMYGVLFDSLGSLAGKRLNAKQRLDLAVKLARNTRTLKKGVCVFFYSNAIKPYDSPVELVSVQPGSRPGKANYVFRVLSGPRTNELLKIYSSTAFGSWLRKLAGLYVRKLGCPFVGVGQLVGMVFLAEGIHLEDGKLTADDIAEHKSSKSKNVKLHKCRYRHLMACPAGKQISCFECDVVVMRCKFAVNRNLRESK